MARRMIVVPYDWAKRHLIRPEDEKHQMDKDLVTRNLNVRVESDERERVTKESESDDEQNEDSPEEQTGEPPEADTGHGAPFSFNGKHSQLKNRLLSLDAIDKDGKVKGAGGKIISRSNVDTILDRLSGTTAFTVGPPPVGTTSLQTILKRNNIVIPQTGTGLRNKWIRV